MREGGGGVRGLSQCVQREIYVVYLLLILGGGRILVCTDTIRIWCVQSILDRLRHALLIDSLPSTTPPPPPPKHRQLIMTAPF